MSLQYVYNLVSKHTVSFSPGEQRKQSGGARNIIRVPPCDRRSLRIHSGVDQKLATFALLAQAVQDASGPLLSHVAGAKQVGTFHVCGLHSCVWRVFEHSLCTGTTDIGRPKANDLPSLLDNNAITRSTTPKQYGVLILTTSLNQMSSTATLRGLAVAGRRGVHPPTPPPTEEDVHDAISSAPILDDSSLVVIPRGSAPNLDARELGKLYDDFEVDFKLDERPPAANVLEVRNFEQLKALMRTFYRAAARRRYQTSEPEHERTLRLLHVLEHVEAAKFMGARGAVFGIKLARHESGTGHRLVYQLYSGPLRLKTTKLGVAAIAAAPERPSECDIADIKAMGYEDVREVADRITRHNRWGPPIFPMPGSIRAALTQLGHARAAQALQ